MDKKGELPLLFSWYFRTFAAVMIVANMNLHEVYADLMGEMGKLDWKRDALLNKAVKGFLAQDGFCFKLSGEETISGEDPVRISFFTTFMPLSEMSDVQREAIFEECMKDLDNLD